VKECNRSTDFREAPQAGSFRCSLRDRSPERNLIVSHLKILPLEQDPDLGRDYLDERSLQIGHVLPPNDKLLSEYFPAEKSYIVLQGKRPVALFSYYPGVHKAVALSRFRLVADSKVALGYALKAIEETALAQERFIVRTTVFGYAKDRVEALKKFGYRIGASLPETVSLGGRRFDYHFIYKDLTGRYHFDAKRSYAKPGLYPSVEVAKAKSPKLKVRGYRPEDRLGLDKFASHPMVIRGIGSGLFEGLYPWRSGTYQEMVDSGRVYPLVCEDEATGEPVGCIDLYRQSQDVMQHCMGLGMYVKPEYQEIGVGTLLTESVKTLARRLHLSRVWLSVFEGNAPAERLYRKAGFVECGKVPGWLQEGYVTEVFMTLKLE
jgi:ribosomal protein S18 acetylase RimI-like enzyme